MAYDTNSHSLHLSLADITRNTELSTPYSGTTWTEAIPFSILLLHFSTAQLLHFSTLFDITDNRSEQQRYSVYNHKKAYASIIKVV
jgi:hypothetical protein